MALQSETSPLILVIDDVSPVVRLIELELMTQGFRTQSILIGEKPVQSAIKADPAAIVLGSSLPAPPVYQVLVELKRSLSVPVLFLHAGGNDSDAALALDMGADDTLGIPFIPEDLSLRLRALLDQSLPEAAKIKRGPLTIDVLHRVTWNGERRIALGTSEWGLLLALIQQEKVVAADELLTSVWGEDYAEELAFLRLWTERLRINIGDDPDDPQILLGNEVDGYRLAD
jgi:two-component system KDP operon response regulator KdpE